MQELWKDSMIDEGGGFTFHVLHCEVCGKDQSVEFMELGELHLRYVKGLPGPYCIATSESDKRNQDEFPGDPLTESEYHAAVESFLNKCACGGTFRFDTPLRGIHCRSTEIDVDEDGAGIMYD